MTHYRRSGLRMICSLSLLSMISLALCLLPRTERLPGQGFRPKPTIRNISANSPAMDVRRASELYSKLPLSFELAPQPAAAMGPTESKIEFVAHGPGYWVGLGRDSVRIASQRLLREGREPLQMRFKNGKPTTQLEGAGKLPGLINYYLGGDRSEWRTGVRQFARVEYHDLYKGVDAVFYGTPRQMEFDFVLAPDADPGSIQMEFGPGTNVLINEVGDLVVEVGADEVQLRRPVIYQEIDGQRKEIPGGFVVQGNLVSFHVGDYDRTERLILDPVLLYSSYLGGANADVIEAVALDSSGNIIVVGYTQSANLATVNSIQSTLRGNSDGFIAKLNPTGSALLFSTYLGGDSEDALAAIAVQTTGSMWVVGSSNSSNFPLLAPLQMNIGTGYDAVIVHVSPTGLLYFSTFWGGNGDDFARAVALDSSSAIYVAGDTFSTNLPIGIAAQPSYGGGTAGQCPTTAAGQPLGGDAFAFKLLAIGPTLRYTTYLGGSGCEAGRGIAVDDAGNAYVTGATTSTNFPTVGPVQSTIGGGSCTPSGGGATYSCPDAFVSKIKPDGSALVYSTYLGGNGLDDGAAIAVDSSGAAYLVGTTQSADFPTESPWQPALRGPQDVFASKLNPAGSALAYSTYFGGTGSESGAALQLDSSLRPYIVGSTSSGDLPLINEVRSTLAGGQDAFAAVLTASGSGLNFSTYFGGSADDQGLGLALDSTGNFWLAGFTDSASFPTSSNPLQANSAGGRDGFLAKISPVAGGPQVSAGGVVNNASFAPSPAPMAPGSIAAVFGTNLNDGSSVLSSAIGSDGKLVTTLGGASVTVNGIAAPMFYSTPSQLGIQIPFEIANSSIGTIVVTVAGQTSAPQYISISNFAPGIFTTNQQGNGLAATLHQDGVTPITLVNPPHLNEVIVFFGTGLGLTSPSLATGELSAGNLTSTPVTATVGGVLATVEFSGTAPGFVGLNQINVRIPASITTGSAVEIVFSIGGQQSNVVTIPVSP